MISTLIAIVSNFIIIYYEWYYSLLFDILSIVTDFLVLSSQAIFLLLFSIPFHKLKHVKGFNTNLMISPFILIALICLKTAFGFLFLTNYVYYPLAVLYQLGLIVAAFEWFFNLKKINAKHFLESRNL